jgi:cytochrome P450
MESRTLTAATELGGVALAKGERIHILFGAVNRDSAMVDDPDTFNMLRPNPQRHMAFGHGIHFCLGAALARLEGRIALEVFKERLPGLRLAPGFAMEYVPNFYFRQPKRVDILWDT